MPKIIKDSANPEVIFRILNGTTGLPVTDYVYEDESSASPILLELWYRRPGGEKVAITPAELASPGAAWTEGTSIGA